MKHIIISFVICLSVTLVTCYIFGTKTNSASSAAPQPVTSTGMIDPEYDDGSMASVENQGVSRFPASTGDDEITQDRKTAADEEISTLVAGDSGIEKIKLKDQKFITKYGEFDVEVVADAHSEDAPSVMKFYVKCEDNRKVKSGNPPSRVLIKEKELTGITTCHFNELKFVENEMYGDSLTVSFNVDKLKELKRKKKANGRDFCDQAMKIELPFPEICAQWNPPLPE